MAAVDKRSGERAKSAMALTKWMVETKVAQVHLFSEDRGSKGQLPNDLIELYSE